MTIRPFLLTQTMNGETFTRPVSSEVAAIYLEASMTYVGREPDQAAKDAAEVLTNLVAKPADPSRDLPSMCITGTLDEGRTFSLTTVSVETPELATPA